ncbi:hypothetical protein [Pontibacter fetidus]|uniref:Uncharacterized protein n=1 Tax=Pontibacter fetidus TaxID=2700082 RepID=A0A6B2H1M6_9BACT|nr:hypothetical protein [Pontibacter fetidus]NDK56028.1 hypothetical protein [Pontibacter fetidus]
MKNENLAIPLILTAFLLVSSFVPIIQILLIYLNSALVYPITIIAGTDIMAVHYVTDGLLAIVTLFSFYYSKKTIWKIFSSIGFTLFMLPMLVYSTEGAFDEKKPILSELHVVRNNNRYTIDIGGGIENEERMSTHNTAQALISSTPHQSLYEHVGRNNFR